MDDLSVFRRFFVASEMIKEILQQGGIRQPTFTNEPQATNSTDGADRTIPPHIGGGVSAPITGTRPVRTTNRSSSQSSRTAPVDTYKFPS